MSKPIPALKYDQGKLPWRLMPFEATEAMLEVLEYGQRKYSICRKCGSKIYSDPRLPRVGGEDYRKDCPQCGSTEIEMGEHNWRKGFQWTRLADAAYRHLTAFVKGEDIDESGLSHLAHCLCMINFLLEHYQQKIGVDDRYIYSQYEKDF